MDIISFLLGYASKKGGSGGSGSGNFDEVDKLLDEINGEVIGESLCYVSFIGADGRELHREPVFEGYDCPDPVASNIIETPTKASTVYETYTFSGWSKTQGGAAEANVLSAIEQDITLYAAFTVQKIYIAQGSCGTNVKWAIDPDYALFITGSGKMTDYASGSLVPDQAAPWWNYRDKIISVDVSEGITEVGQHAFSECTAIVRASLPSTLTGAEAIGWSAFNGCSSLSEINIPNNVYYIASRTFGNCVLLQSITLPTRVFSIEGDAFKGCTNLTNAVVGTPVGWALYTGNGNNLVASYTTEQMSDPAQAASILVNDGASNNQFKRPNT